jgi:hypothetical protein
MTTERWATQFQQYRTRAEIRRVLTSEMQLLLQSNRTATLFPPEVARISTRTDHDVLESFARLKAFSGGMREAARRSVVGAICDELCELFSMALARMKDLPPDASTLDWRTA